MTGKLIVIDGNDGAGKETQAKLTVQRMKDSGISVVMFDFPQYGKPCADLVERLLRGEFGSSDQVGPYDASICYAVDRWQAAPMIREHLEQGTNVVCNRYTQSSKAYWGCKILDPEERMKYFNWLDNLEHNMFSIPRPDLSFFLFMPPEIGQRLVDEKKGRTYVEGRDIIEANIAHLQAAVKVYDEMTDLYGWHKIVCGAGDEPRRREDINDELYGMIMRDIS